MLIHGWDLTIATGQDATIDPTLVAACLAVGQPQADMLRAGGSFGGRVDTPVDAHPQIRLVALLGRRSASATGRGLSGRVWPVPDPT